MDEMYESKKKGSIAYNTDGDLSFVHKAVNKASRDRSFIIKALKQIGGYSFLLISIKYWTMPKAILLIRM